MVKIKKVVVEMSYYGRNRGGGRRYKGYSQRNGSGSYYNRRNGRRYGGGNGFTYGNMWDKVVRDVYKIKSLINTEFKTNDIVASTTITTTPLISNINGLATGDQFNTRDGRVVRWKSVEVMLNISMHTTPIEDSIRIMVVIDKQPNEIVMVIGDLLTATTMQGLKNLDGRRRFIILKDTTLDVSVGKGTNITWKWYKKIDMKSIYDDSDAGSIVDLTTNAMYLVLFGTEATNGMTVGRSTRMRFIDN